MTIKAKHPVREAYAACSTGNSPGRYYETKGHAVHAFESALKEHGFCFDPDEFVNLPDNEGRATLCVRDEDGEYAGPAVFTWYRMPSGRYECISYLA